MDRPAHNAVTWLLNSDEPAIGVLARRDVLGEPAEADAGLMLAGPRVTALLSGQRPGGGFGVHPYRKWTGAHWRLVSLAELGIPPPEPRAAAAGLFLDHRLFRGLAAGQVINRTWLAPRYPPYRH